MHDTPFFLHILYTLIDKIVSLIKSVNIDVYDVYTSSLAGMAGELQGLISYIVDALKRWFYFVYVYQYSF